MADEWRKAGVVKIGLEVGGLKNPLAISSQRGRLFSLE
jgi:hypothetical protein